MSDRSFACRGTTATGEKCTRVASPGQTRCWQHKGSPKNVSSARKVSPKRSSPPALPLEMYKEILMNSSPDEVIKQCTYYTTKEISTKICTPLFWKQKLNQDFAVSSNNEAFKEYKELAK